MKCDLIFSFQPNLISAVGQYGQIWLKRQLHSVSNKLDSSLNFGNISSVVNKSQSMYLVIQKLTTPNKNLAQHIQGMLDECKKATKDVEMAPQRIMLMSCGSYNPPTNMHLRMFEVARDHLHRMGSYVVVGGIISPVHDGYNKKDLVSSLHRCSMLKLALQNSDWIHLSTWETKQNCWTKTRISLQYHQNRLNSALLERNEVRHNIPVEDIDWIPDNIKNSTDRTPIQIKLLCGADLLESFGIPGLWMDEDIEAIVSQHGLIVVTREGANPHKFIYDSDILSTHMRNISIVTEWIPNEISSTKIRRALKRGESVRYLIQDSVIDYVYRNGIYNAKTTTTLM